MRTLFCILLFLFPFIGSGQEFTLEEQYQIDSLDAIITNPKSTEVVLAETYVRLSNILYISNLDTIFPLSINAIKAVKKGLAKKPSKTDRERILRYKVEAINNIGYLKLMKGESNVAIDYYNKAKVISEQLGDQKALSTYYASVGYIYDNNGDIEKALDYYHKSLKINETLKNKKGISIALNNIGSIYNDQGDDKKALECYFKSLKLSEEISDKQGVAQALNNIGYTYEKQNNTEKGIEYYDRSLGVYIEIGDKQGIASSMSNIGHIYKNSSDTNTCLNYYHKSLNIYREVGDKEGIAYILNNIAIIQLKRGNIRLAHKNAMDAYLIAKELGYPINIHSTSKLLSDIYTLQGNYSAALELYKQAIVMRDSINNESTQKATAQQQAKYEYEKQKAVDDAEHEKQLAIEQEAKEKQQILTFATAGGLGLVGIFLIFVFNRLKVTRKQKRIIEVAHHELEEKNTEILDSITYAKRIQSAILPPDKVVKEYLAESFILYKPKDIVAGDFYWLEAPLNLPKGESEGAVVLFAAADCTGHGVPGAMVSVVCNNGLNRSVREYGLTDPGEILNKTREIVVQEFEKSEEEVKDGMDIALCSLQNNTLQYAGAHNPLWIIRPRHSALDAESPKKNEIAGQANNDEYELLETKANKQPIGQFENPEPYTTHTIELQKGDSIYIFSDGYADQFGGEKGKKMKSANFKKLLLSIQQESMQKQKQLIDEAFESWKGTLEQLDDVCVIGVKI